MIDYEPVIGLEVHVQLKTKAKAFCACSTEFGKGPNTQVCPVCLGLPGSLPVLNKLFLEYALRVALALNCKAQEFTKFDRKNYFYPDLPKDYQISQYDLPLSKNGFLDVDLEGKVKRIGIRRVHMEEDAGKLIHQKESSLVDFNRTGIPLLEIVSEPELYSPQEAYEYLSSIKSVIEYLDVSDCDMEKGSLRCDANISLRPKGTKELGIKTELKNMNSFKAVRDALNYEIERQNKMLHENKALLQETRLWDTKEMATLAMRTKEEAQDYRYFPEPDLPPFMITNEFIDSVKKSIPELPRQKEVRLTKEYGLSGYEAKMLVVSKKDSFFSEACLKAYPDKDKRNIVNWLIGPLSSEANSRNLSISGMGIKAEDLVCLIKLVEKQEISNLTAKSVLTQMIDTQRNASGIIKEKNLSQVSDFASLESIVESVIKENPKSVSDFESGKANVVMFLVGQAMKKSGGKANPKVVQEIIKRRLSNV